MAKEYISREAFNNAIREAISRYPNTFYNGLETARQIALDLPAADVMREEQMSGIYIQTNIPEKSRTLLIFKDGRALDVHTGERFMAIFVPDHGDLIDRDALMKNLGDVEYKGAIKRVLIQAPTVIPADKEGEV